MQAAMHHITPFVAELRILVEREMWSYGWTCGFTSAKQRTLANPLGPLTHSFYLPLTFHTL